MSYSEFVLNNSAENSNNNDKNIGQIVFNKYLIEKKLGSGSYGTVYSATNLTNNTLVAVKVSPLADGEQLKNEHNIVIRADGFPKWKHYGHFGNEQLALVMQHLGHSLAHLMDYCSRKFSLETVVLLADQMIKRVEDMHLNNIVHRDLKPDNFVMGLGKHMRTCYVIDFGVSRCIHDKQTGRHIPFRENQALYGTHLYASLNGLRGYTVSRRDDIETLGIIFVLMATGRLPWDGIQASTDKQRLEKLTEIRLRTSIEELCKGLPEEFVLYFQYCKKLNFEDNPDHHYLRGIFQSLGRKIHGSSDETHEYDWIRIKEKRELESRSHTKSGRKRKL